LEVMQAMTVSTYNKGKYWAIGYPYSETGPMVNEAVSLGIYTPPARPHAWPDIVAFPPLTSMNIRKKE
jgi:hypothetical protein